MDTNATELANVIAPLTDAYFEAGDFTDAAFDAYIAAVDARLRLLGTDGIKAMAADGLDIRKLAL